MGAAPSRESSGTIRTLRYGNHEIGLIPLTRQFFNKENPELCRQFIRVRNDPNVRYCHMRSTGYGMSQLPPADFTQADLDALVDTVEASMFDTNEEFLKVDDGSVSALSISQMHRILQLEGIIDLFDPALDTPVDNATSAQQQQQQQPVLESTDLSEYVSGHNSPPASRSGTAAAEEEEEEASAVPGAAAATVSPSPLEQAEVRVEATFLRLKAALQAHYRATERGDDVDYEAKAAATLKLFQSPAYRRFKRAIRPLPCAVVFIYVNSREEHDCFAFRGHRVNVIGCFGLRTREDESDDSLPLLQVRKGIVKAAGDRTLERVLALAAKTYADTFKECVLRELQRTPASQLLRHVGQEGRLLLREVSRGLAPGGTEPSYEPVSVANALFFERMRKYPLLAAGLFNNYPTLKFIYDFSALAISVDDRGAGRSETIRLCTYRRKKDERGLMFLYPGRLLAYTWLWTAMQTSQSTVRDSWVQYSLNEFAQLRERHVQKWLLTSPYAKTILGNEATTTYFLEHLENLHSEIVRARTTPTTDHTSWATAHEYSYDTKLYRIFISPICGPLLTTVKEPKEESAAASAGKAAAAKKAAAPNKASAPRAAAASNPVSASRGGGGGAVADASGTGNDPAAGLLGTSQTTMVVDLLRSGAAPPGHTAALTTPPYTALATHTPGGAAGQAAGPVASATRKAATGAARDAQAEAAHQAGLPPPSYSATTPATGSAHPLAAYPHSTMPTYATTQAPHPMYMSTVANTVAANHHSSSGSNVPSVPATPSHTSWVVPQFAGQPLVFGPGAAGSGAMHPAFPSPSPPTAVTSLQQFHADPAGALGAGAGTYIVQIAGDGTQTIVPLSQFTPTAVQQQQYQIASVSNSSLPPSNAMAGGFPSSGNLPGMHHTAAVQHQQQQQQQQQQQFFSVSASSSVGGNSGSRFYTPAFGYSPASFITPVAASQQLYSPALPTVTAPQYAAFPNASPAMSIALGTPPSSNQRHQQQQHHQPYMLQGEGQSVVVSMMPLQPPTQSYAYSQSALGAMMGSDQSTVAGSSASLLNQSNSVSQTQPQLFNSHSKEENEIFEGALRMLDEHN